MTDRKRFRNQVEDEGIFLSVVIPIYNEENNISLLCQELAETLDEMAQPYEIIFIDDGSDDASFERLISVRDKFPDMKIIKFKKNYGQSAALDAGFKNAVGDIIVSLDGDRQNDPKDIPRMIEELEKGYDVICGWRYQRKDPFLKRFISRGAYILRNIILKDRIHDSGCTLRAYRKVCFEQMQLYGEMHRFIPALLAWEGFKVTEVKVNHRPRLHGKTKYTMSRIFKGILDMVIVKFWVKYSSRPVHFFGGMGLFMGFLGFILSLYLTIVKLFFHQSIGNRPLLLLSILLIIVGVQFLLFGILADIMMKLYFGEKRRTYFIDKII